MFDYGGAIHIHSSYSFDGNTAVGDIIAAAKRQGLDFIVLTDHFRLDAKQDGWEGWHDGVLVIVGEEISPRYNHYLALEIDRPVVFWKKCSPPQAYIDAVNKLGGFGLIAHPDHVGTDKFGVKSYAWKDWSVKGYAGMSVWDLMTDWQEKLTSLPAALLAFAFPAWHLSGPKEETLRRWDEQNRQGRITGFGEVDNHNTPKRFGGLKVHIFPFDFAFSTIRTRVVLEEPLSADGAAAKQQVCEALKKARAYVAQERWRAAKDFQFRIYNGTASAYMGDEFTLTTAARADVQLPSRGRIRLLRDGRTIAQTEGERLSAPVDQPGVYRVEVGQKRWGRYKPWIYSNPIRVRG